MRFWAGVTDYRWYEYLALRRPDEVNFWQPSATAPFTNLPPGTPFLFKLRRPYNHIAGGGYFVKFSTLPLPMAWDAFGQKNGAESLEALEELIRPLAAARDLLTLEIGCTVLAEPFFLPRRLWIEMGDEWPSNVVRGKSFDDSQEAGQTLWDRLTARMREASLIDTVADQIVPDGEGARYGELFLRRARLGQGAFRLSVIDAYRRKCAITGESTLPVLEAAHIQPFAREGPNRTCNGLLLRADFHKLFDSGLVTVTPDLRIRVSRRIKDKWFNGQAYYRLDGKEVAVMPESPADRPDPSYLQWHAEQQFVA